MTAGQRRQSCASIPHVLREITRYPAGCGPRDLCASDETECRQLVGSYATHIFSVHLHSTIQPAHRLLVESSAQKRERSDRAWRSLLQLARHQRGSFIWRKEAPIVREGDEIVFRQQSIGGVSIDYINRARRERLIFYRGRKRADGARMNSINARQPDEPIASPNKVRGESSGQVLALSREIAQRSQMITCGGLTGHSDCIRILESEWRQPANMIHLRELSGHVRPYLAWIRGDRIRKRIVENCNQARTRVFGIDIDRIGAKGAEGDLGGAKAGPAIYGKVVRLEQLREHLAQQEGLAERL